MPPTVHLRISNLPDFPTSLINLMSNNGVYFCSSFDKLMCIFIWQVGTKSGLICAARGQFSSESKEKGIQLALNADLTGHPNIATTICILHVSNGNRPGSMISWNSAGTSSLLATKTSVGMLSLSQAVLKRWN